MKKIHPPLDFAHQRNNLYLLVAGFLREQLLPAEASASFITGIFSSGPVDPCKHGSTGLIFE